MTESDKLLKYREQHKHRLNYMPWLYWRLKDKHLIWAKEWQQQYQSYLQDMEDIEIGENCFISPLAHIFAERGRKIKIGNNSFVAADSMLHGPLTIGNEVAINHHCTLDGGRVGIHIADQARLAAYTHIYAFNHGMKIDDPIYQQAVTSKGISIGRDVWIGADVGIVDGVNIADYAIIAMNAIVTKDVEKYAIMAGNPAQKIGDRRDKK